MRALDANRAVLRAAGGYSGTYFRAAAFGRAARLTTPEAEVSDRRMAVRLRGSGLVRDRSAPLVAPADRQVAVVDCAPRFQQSATSMNLDGLPIGNDDDEHVLGEINDSARRVVAQERQPGLLARPSEIDLGDFIAPREIDQRGGDVVPF